MQRSGRILILLGIVLGGLALIAAFVALNPERNRAQSEPQVKVVVARRLILPRTTITTDTLTTAEWPAASAPRGVYTETESLVGKLATSQIAEGQPILQGMVIDKEVEEQRRGVGSNASFIVPNGFVAMSYAVDNVTGVAGALKEGDRVDVLASYEIAATGTLTGSGGSKRQITQIALQDVEILRVGSWAVQSAETGAATAPLVTFLLSPQDALTLKFLRETSTSLHLVLRAAGDHQRFRTQPIILEYIDIRFGYNGALLR